MEPSKLLVNFGLNQQEITIYLAALELGQALPKHIADKAKIKRPTLYKLLPDLMDKGLISKTIKGKRRYLVAEDLEKFIENKKAELVQIESVLPQLRLLLITAIIKPTIIFYEGVEGIKKVYFDNLRVGEPILELVSLENIHPEIEFHSKNYYIPSRIKKRLPIKILVSGTTESKLINLKTDPYDLREVRIIDKNTFPIPLDCYIYGDNISFALYRTDSEPVGLIIRSKEIATTLRSIFNLAWNNAKSIH